MQVKEIQSKKLFKEYSIEVPSKIIEEKIDNKIKELAPKTNLPGFRPGKAPINLVKKKYEKDILGEIINITVQENSKKLLNEKNLKPLRLPKIKITKFDMQTYLEFNIQIDLPPEFDLYNFEKIKVNEYKVNLSEKDKEKNYQNFINSQSHYHSLKNNRSVKESDRLLISFYSEDKEVPEVLRKQEKVNVIIGSNFQILPNLDKILLEKKVKKNDKILVDISLERNETSKNKTKHKFNISILDIEELHKIKVDDDYLKKNNIKSHKELKNKIEDNIKNQYGLMAAEISKKELLDSLEKVHTFDLPEGILSDEKNSIWQKVELAKKNGTLDPDDKGLSEEELKKRYNTIAKRRVKLALIVSNIANKNNIKVENDEIKNGLIDYAKNYPGQEKQIFEYFKKNPSEIEIIRGPLFEKKVIEYVLSKVKKNEKKIDMKEFMEIQSKAFQQN